MACIPIQAQDPESHLFGDSHFDAIQSVHQEGKLNNTAMPFVPEDASFQDITTTKPHGIHIPSPSSYDMAKKSWS